MNELIKIILLYLVTPVAIAFGWIYLSGEIWAKGKIVLGDIFRR